MTHTLIKDCPPPPPKYRTYEDGYSTGFDAGVASVFAGVDTALVNAAPALLEALEKIAAIGGPNNLQTAIARNAIALAKGG